MQYSNISKQELRRHIREQKKHLLTSQRSSQSENICQLLFNHINKSNARTVLLYSSLPDEVDICILTDKLKTSGIKVLMPVICGSDLELRVFDGENNMRREPSFGILEPQGSLFLDYLSIDVAIVPGMAFDMSGNRLGRGKGYYDRLLSRLSNAELIGVCFDFQLLPEIPTEEHDIKMDRVITNRTIHEYQKRGY